MRSKLILAAATLLVAGCGGGNETIAPVDPVTSQQAATAPGQPAATAPPAATGTAATPPAQGTTPAGTPPPAAVQPDAQFCQNDSGNQLRQLSDDATAAFNAAKAADFTGAVDKALKISESAPPGSACVRDALNGMAALADNGAANLKGVDTKALVKKIRDFEDARQIAHP